MTNEERIIELLNKVGKHLDEKNPVKMMKFIEIAVEKEIKFQSQEQD